MGSVAVNPPLTPVTKGSSGTAPAATPNVCKMPGPPAPFVPTPLPNIGMSGDSPDGYTKKVIIEGKKVAIKGASFKSKGDIASKGTGGGLISATTHGKTKFVAPGSTNVKAEGKNIHLLGDAMTNNHSNPGNGGVTPKELQAPKTALEKDLKKIAKKCNKKIEKANDKKKAQKKKGESCTVRGTRKHKCCEDELNKLKGKGKHKNVQAEWRDKGGKSRLDVVVFNGSPAVKNVTKIYDFKFNCKSKPKMSRDQARKYRKRYGRNVVIKLVGG